VAGQMLDPPPPWTNQNIIVYHGTTSRHAGVILAHGVQVSFGRAAADFGSGFYTTTSERQARSWAWHLANQDPNGTPAVVAFEVSREALAGLETLSFVRGDYEAEDFWSFVVHCRSGANTHTRVSAQFYDVVAGPVAGAWKQRVQLHDYDQISFHTPVAEAVLNGSRRWRV
jgi:Protein of unknown function (DUF3990)